MVSGYSIRIFGEIMTNEGGFVYRYVKLVYFFRKDTQNILAIFNSYKKLIKDLKIEKPLLREVCLP